MSATSGLPEISFPRTSDNRAEESAKFFELMISER